MAIVSDYLKSILAAQMRDPQVAVWFDPEEHYREFVAGLELAGTVVERYDGSFFGLRRRIDPHMSGETPVRLLVYVPLAADSPAYGEALIELTAPGVVLAPGQRDPNRNTKLSYVARQAVLAQPENWTEATANNLARQIDAGQIGSLAEADRSAEQSRGTSPGAIPLIFGLDSAQEVALLFLGSDAHDSEIVSKDAVEDLARLLGEAYGVRLIAAEPVTLRDKFARHILTSELAATVAGDLPGGLHSVPVAPPGATREAAQRLAETWRNRRDLRESYAAQSARVAAELNLSNVGFSLDAISGCETFLELETQLQTRLEERLAQGAAWGWEEHVNLKGLIDGRMTDFWSIWPERYPGVGARWQLIGTALELLFTAARLEGELKAFRGGPADLLARYTNTSDAPWCLLDTYQRHLEHRWHDFDFDSSDTRHETLGKLIEHARQRYMSVGGDLAERFVRALQAAKFKAPGALRQVEIFERFVAPGLKNGEKTAYVLVDALRFEMARELIGSMEHNFDSKLDYALASVPTITEIGMASLMPQGEGGARVVPQPGGKLGLSVGDVVLKDRATRLSWLRSQMLRPLTVAKLEDMLPRPKRALDTELQNAALILVTSQEIDALGEDDNAHSAHRQMSGVLPELAKLINKLADYGCRRIIVTADHGFLFTEELDTDRQIDAPGGQEADLHRRVWVGRGGIADPSVLRAPLKSMGLNSDLDFATPWGFGFFTARGGSTGGYMHGGLSPQELVVPLAVLTPKSAAPIMPTEIDWDLVLGFRGNKITNRYFSVQVGGVVKSLFSTNIPQVRIEVRDKNTVISTPISTFYDTIGATGEVTMRMLETDARQIEQNTITLAITEEPEGKTVSILLLNATSGQTLKQIDNITVSFAI